MADKRISQLAERVDIANNDVVAIVASGATATNKATISSIQAFMQGALDVGVTSVGVTISEIDTAPISVTGSPITTSGNITINLPRATNSIRGVLDSEDFINFSNKQNTITLTTSGTSGNATFDGSLLNIPNYTTDTSGFVTLDTAQTITGLKTITASGGSDTLIVNHTSGSGIALDISKAGNGEGLRVAKSSGSGNAVTISGGNLEAPTIVKTGGTSSQFLKADGSIDSTAYTTNTGTVTSVAASAGTGISITGSPITSSGTLSITNTAPDQVVSLTASTGISVSGTYPNFTITNTSPSSGGTVTSVSGTGTVSGLTLSGTVTSSGNLTLGGTLSLTSGNVTDALGFTPYNATNPAGYITSSALSAYLPLTGGTLTGALNGTTAQFSGDISTSTRLASAAGGQQIIIAANLGSSTNRIETTGSLNFALVSSQAISLAAGGTIPQLTISTAGATTLTGALNGTSAVFSGGVTSGAGSGNTLSLGSIDVGKDIGLVATQGIVVNNARILAFASTGAATFSSSVMLGGTLFANTQFNNTVLSSSDATNIANGFNLLGSSSFWGIRTLTGGDFSLDVFNNNSPKSALYITNTGNVGIGTTDLVAARFRVKSTTTTNGNFALYVENSTLSGLFIVRDDGLINTGTFGAAPFNNATTGRDMVIESNGTLGYLVSTRESKANIKSISNVDFISQLNPVQFNYRKKDSETNEFTDELYENINYGFIADEVESVNKELVFYNEDGTLAGVEYNNMIAILTKAIQELKTQIDSLKNQIK